MKKIDHEQAKIIIDTYKQKDKIQVFCLVSSNSECPLCKGILNTPNLFTQLEDDGLIEAYIIDMQEIFKVFPTPFKFMMYYYIPWNEKQSPQFRDHYLLYEEMKLDFLYWINKVRK